MTTALHVRHAARSLRHGGIVAYPTEGVWGIGCNPLDPAAVQRLLILKQRPLHKGLILIADEFAALAPFIAQLTPAIEKRVHATWPGPTTWLLPAAAHTPQWLRGAHDSIAVRVTAHPVASTLCRSFGGAVVSTSANRSGHPPARSALRARRQFPQGVDLWLPGATGGASAPTEIRDGLTGRLVRAG